MDNVLIPHDNWLSEMGAKQAYSAESPQNQKKWEDDMKERKKTTPAANTTHALQFLTGDNLLKATESHVHTLGKGFKCRTETRGYITPNNKSPLELVINKPAGFIALWEKESTLHWRFQEASLAALSDPEGIKEKVRVLIGKALLAWGDAVPVMFSEHKDNWDFEIAIRNVDDCDINGCTLASAFFPDAGQHELVIYPKIFEQSEKEQTDTLAHEFGHVFGLRHFFALLQEQAWPAEIFGTHAAFSIMNYGSLSELTDTDKKDLKNLYELAWNGKLTNINKTPIRFVRPHHLSGSSP
ncbi:MULTISPECIES: matrixin family metalloprotease [Citrobacter]|nr:MULTISPECIES: matrixin family metalloprotease [Citrobacter]MDM3271224.1 hypothetical protein [Citrobacter sp. Ce129]